jgi:hypothetical protein
MVREHSSRKARQRRTLTPADQEARISGPDAIKEHGADHVHSERRRLKRVRIGLMRIVCSEAWFDANWFGCQMIVGDACKRVAAPYPPGGDESLMVCCKRCNRATPPQCVSSSGHCDDCRLCLMSPEQIERLPGSTSSINLARLKSSIRRGEQYRGGFWEYVVFGHVNAEK